MLTGDARDLRMREELDEKRLCWREFKWKALLSEINATVWNF